MDEYIDNLSAPSERLSGDPERPLDAEELAQYRSLLAKARWPVNRVVPELAYGVSALAQLSTNKVGEVTVHHATELRKLIKRLKVLKDRGRACLYVRKLDLSSLVCPTYFDASVAPVDGFRSHGDMSR